MTILCCTAIQGKVARLKLRNAVSLAARHLHCWALQRIDAKTHTETQVLYSNSCGAVRSGAVVSQIIEMDKSISSK